MRRWWPEAFILLGCYTTYPRTAKASTALPQKPEISQAGGQL